MSNNKQTGRGFGAKGYYIALILCATAIGISGYLYYRNANEPATAQVDNTTPSLVAGVTEGDHIPVIATQPSGTTTPAATGENTVPPTKVFKTAMPVRGETVAEYAMDCLSYNETTRDWRVHNGVDIAAEAGTAVMAAADGEIYTIYNDETMGTTVVIRHDEGYTSKYACLDEEVSVSAGDQVILGQQIGCVGTTALLESALGPHVHFSVTCDNEAIDPAEFFSMN